MTPKQAMAGTVLNDRYTLVDRIASGGMGEVWAATDTVLGRDVAVKLLHPALSSQSDFVERFRAEARHTAALHHPNIATVFDYGEDGGTAYLVMELVAGQPLSRLIAERAPLSAQETVSILIQAATALEAAHRGGVLHRDVKPANILVTPDGTAKLTDFGISRAVDISRALDAAPLTQTGQILGTAQYLSPEQALGERATVSSDIYALGVIGHEMLTGRRPFDAESLVATALAHVSQPPPQLPDTVPAGVREVIDACLAKAPADRPPSAAAVANALRMPGVTSAPGASAAPAATAAFGSAAPVISQAAPTQSMPAMPAVGLPADAVVLPAAAVVLPGSAQVAPTQALPAVAMPAEAMPAAAMPAGGSGIPDKRSRGRKPWLLGAAATALVALTLFAMSGTDRGETDPRVPLTPLTTTTSSPTPSTSAPVPVAPPAVTPSPPNQPSERNDNSGKGNGNDDDDKKDGKQ